jgi:hypothetical protein
MIIARLRAWTERARASLRGERGRRWVPGMPSQEEAEEYMARNAVRWRRERATDDPDRRDGDVAA